MAAHEPPKIARLPGYLAIWNGLYMASLYLLVADLVGQPASIAHLGIAWLAGHGTFLLDRVKPSSRFEDPADRQADPERADFLDRHARPLRIWVALVAIAGVLGAAFSHWLLVGPMVAAFLGAFIYGSSPRPRPKDRLLAKNLLVGVAMASLAAALLWTEGISLSIVMLASALLVPIVTVDAMLCDLPDRDSDRQHGTRTLAGLMGTSRTLIAALAVLTVSTIAVTFVAPPLHSKVAWAFMAGLIVTTPGVYRLPSRWIRDAIDLRIPLLAGIVHLALREGWLV